MGGLLLSVAMGTLIGVGGGNDVDDIHECYSLIKF